MKSWHGDLIRLRATSTHSITELSRILHRSRRAIYRVLGLPEAKAEIARIKNQDTDILKKQRQDLIARSYAHIEAVLRADIDDPVFKDKTRVALETLKGTGEFVAKSQVEETEGARIRTHWSAVITTALRDESEEILSLREQVRGLLEKVAEG